MGSDTTKTSIDLSQQTDEAQRKQHADEKAAQTAQDAAGGEKPMADAPADTLVTSAEPEKK